MKPNIRLVAIVLLLSGAGSLTLEMVWSRLLRLVFGSTTLAISTILVAYMFGLGIGALLGGRLAARIRNGIRLYGWIEIGIGAYALSMPFLFELFPGLTHALLGSLPFWPATFGKFLIATLAMLVPTMMMGATLPLLVHAFDEGRSTVAGRAGLLYGFNTLGAVLGVVVGTFVLFPWVGLRATNTIAAGLDLGIGAFVVLWLARRTEPTERPAAADVHTPILPQQQFWSPALVAYGIVGFTALGLEVCWTRALTMAFGSSIYAFATILAVFLLGISLGSLVARPWVQRTASPTLLFGMGLGLLALLVTIASTLLDRMPNMVAGILAGRELSGYALLIGGIQASFLTILAPTLVMGALFPLAVRILVIEGRPSANAVGDVYFINTLGSALGAFLTGFVLMPWIGLQKTLAILVALSLLAAAGVMGSLWRSSRFARLGAIATLSGAVISMFTAPSIDLDRLTVGSFYHPRSSLDFGVATEPVPGYPEGETLFYRDGVNGTVSINRTPNGIGLRINGKTDASYQDMETQVLLGHLAMVYGKEHDDVLVIGMGSGVTTGAVTLYDPNQIDLVEMEPAVLEASQFFNDVNNRPLSNPAVHVVIDDARNHLAHTARRYDVVTSEPSNPWVSGASNLFTAEFFRDVKRVLRPGGRLLQWIQLYGMDRPSMGSLLAAMRTEFPFIYGFRYSPNENDLLVIGTDEPLSLESLPIWTRLPDAARRDLERIGIGSTADLWSLMVLLPEHAEALAAGATPNSDDNMFVELRTPWVMYDSTSDVIESLEPEPLGILPLVSEFLDSGDVASLALSNLWLRNDARRATALIDEAKRRGTSATVRVAEAELQYNAAPHRPQPVLELLDQALELEPDGYFQNYASARLRFNTSVDLEQALLDIDRAIRIRPESWPARRLRMDLLVLLEDWDAARTEADLLTHSPYIEFDWRIWADAALLSGALGRPEDGLEEMHRYFERNPYSQEEWLWVAKTLNDSGRSEQAWWAKERADRIGRNKVRYGHRFALWLEMVGKPELARRNLQLVLDLDPEYAAAREDLARVEKAIGL